MKKKGILLVVLLLAVGFAAVSTTLFINGTIGYQTNKSDFEVYYSKAKVNGVEDNTVITDDTHIVFTQEMKKVGETYVLDYDVTNGSRNYDAALTMTCTESNEYLSVTNIFDTDTNLPATETRSGKLTIELIKGYAGEETKEVTIECTINANAVERNTLSEGTPADKIEPVLDRTLFQSFIVDNNPTSIVFTNTGATNKTDISKAQDGSVQAWIDGTTMYVSNKNAGESVIAPVDSSDLFARETVEYDSSSDIDLSEYKFSSSSNYYYKSTSGVGTEYVYWNKEKNDYTTYKSVPFGKNIESIDVKYLDVSNVTNMSYMFYWTGYETTTFDIRNLSGWNVSNVTTMTNMFCYTGKNATIFNIGDLSSWDTSNVTDMSGMFNGAGQNATTFDIGDLSSWDVSNVTNMSSMFHSAGRNSTTFNLNLSNWNVSNVTVMTNTFTAAGQNATTFSIGDLSSWDVSNVTTMYSMFSNTGINSTTFDIGDLSSWDVSNVTTMRFMFSDAGRNSTTFNIGDLSSWDVSNVTNMSSMFHSAGRNSTTFDIGDLSSWDVSNVTDMSSMFYWTGSKTTTFDIGDLSSWDVSNVTDMSNMFFLTGSNSTTFDIGDLSSWDVSNVTDMKGMFYYTGENATTFSIGDLSSWDVSNVINMNSMFTHAGYKATYSLNLSRWNVNKVTSYIYFNSGVESKVTAPTWVN